MTAPPVDQQDWQNPQSGMAGYVNIEVGKLLAVAASSGPYDMSAYSTYVLWLVDASFNGALFNVSDPDSNTPLWALTTPPDGLGVAGLPIRAPVTTKQIKITNSGTEALRFSLSASSRVATTPPSRFAIIDSDNLTRASAAVSGTVNLGYLQGAGKAFCMLGVSGATVLGTFAIRSGADVFDIADTAEMHTNPFGGRSIYRELVIPRGLCALEFHTQTTGTAALNAHFTYAG